MRQRQDPAMRGRWGTRTYTVTAAETVRAAGVLTVEAERVEVTASGALLCWGGAHTGDVIRDASTPPFLLLLLAPGHWYALTATDEEGTPLAVEDRPTRAVAMSIPAPSSPHAAVKGAHAMTTDEHDQHERQEEGRMPGHLHGLFPSLPEQPARPLSLPPTPVAAWVPTPPAVKGWRVTPAGATATPAGATATPADATPDDEEEA